jgi:RHS repeat-associated protein
MRFCSDQSTRKLFYQGVNIMDNLTYTYDTAGQRTGMGGSFARTLLPTAVPSASYDANNRQTAWGTKALTYDINGNLTADGTYTYLWNARDQLTQVKQGATTVSSYTYDAVGRRTAKTLGAATTSYLYDGVNAVKEVTGSSTADLLSLGVDQVFSRSETSGTQSLLTDGLGSTLALGDGAGTLSTTYTYGAYGQTQSAGAASTNSTQYTGREQDAAGLYYYRARYYSTDLNRFISQDPIGLGGGLNWYGYANGNPVLYTDPSGNFFLIDTVVAAGVGGLFGEISNGINSYTNGKGFWGGFGTGFVGGAASGTLLSFGVPPPLAGAAGALVTTGLNDKLLDLRTSNNPWVNYGFNAATGSLGAWAGTGFGSVTNPTKAFIGATLGEFDVNLTANNATNFFGGINTSKGGFFGSPTGDDISNTGKRISQSCR